MTVVFITFVNSLEKLLWTCLFWVPTRGQVTIYLNLLTKSIHIHTYLNSENCHLPGIHLTIISERIIELKHNRSIQSPKTWYLSIGTHFEILTLIQLSQSVKRTKMPNLRNGSKGGFEPGLTRLRVRHSTAEL